MLTKDEIQYIIDNNAADTTRLLLGAKPAGINVPLCVKCIEARKKIKLKAPHWYSVPSLVYPFSVSVEQGSSQATALFKQQLIQEVLGISPTTCSGTCSDTCSGTSSTNEGAFMDGNSFSSNSSTNEGAFVDRNSFSANSSTNEGAFVDGKQNLSGSGIAIADLTGGMGIDSYFISQIADTHYYFERNTELCEATEYNFRQLGADNIIVSNRDITADNCAALEDLKDKNISLIYIDPARRDKTGGKAILLQEYEPNIVELQEKLFEISRYILVKVSPMADITLNLKLLPQTSKVYIVSVDNECKELLFLLEKNFNGTPFSHVAFLYNSLKNSGLQNTENKNIQILNFKAIDYQLIVQNCDATKKGKAIYTSEVKRYLYEPYKGWLKAGAFNLVSERYNCEKLATSTHLYTSDNEINDFPGKRYRVEEVIPFNKKSLKKVAKTYPKADITARNFPLDTNALKKLSGIKDGGNRHIFATTLHNGTKVLIVTLSSFTTD